MRVCGASGREPAEDGDWAGQVFEVYQKSRVSFVQTVADLATRPQNIEALRYPVDRSGVLG